LEGVETKVFDSLEIYNRNGATIPTPSGPRMIPIGRSAPDSSGRSASRRRSDAISKVVMTQPGAPRIANPELRRLAKTATEDARTSSAKA